MTDHFSNRARTIGDPAVTAFDIIPNDNKDLAQVTTALNVETPGNVQVTTADGSTAVLSIHPGHAFPIRAARIWLTGTTATGIRGLA